MIKRLLIFVLLLSSLATAQVMRSGAPYWTRNVGEMRSGTAPAAITLTQSTNGSNGGTTNTEALTLNSVTVGAGDLIIVGVNWGNNASVNTDYTITDDAGNSYNLVPSNPVSDTAVGGNELAVAYAINTNSLASLTTTVTIANGGNHALRMGLYEYHATNGWQNSPFDVSNVHGTTVVTSSPTTNAITPSRAGELIFAAVEATNTHTANSITVNSPFTLQDAGGTAGAGWHSDTRADGADIQSGAAASSTTATFNWGLNSGYAATIAAFKPMPTPVFVTAANGVTASVANAAAVATFNSTLGNCLIAFTQGPANNTDTVTMSDSSGGTWTQTASSYSSNGTSNRAAMFVKPNSAAVTSVTATWNNAVAAVAEIIVFEFSGMAASAAEDSSVNSTDNTTTTATSGQLTTTHASDVLVFAIRVNGAYSSPTAGAGYTIPANGDTGHRAFMQYKIVTATQSPGTTTMTWTNSLNDAGIYAGFKAAP